MLGIALLQSTATTDISWAFKALQKGLSQLNEPLTIKKIISDSKKETPADIKAHFGENVQMLMCYSHLKHDLKSKSKVWNSFILENFNKFIVSDVRCPEYRVSCRY